MLACEHIIGKYKLPGGCPMSEKPKTAAELASMGGKAAAAKMTSSQRSERAKQAAAARWGAELPRATHGSQDRPLTIGAIKIQAYVLEDGTRVLTQGDFQEALGRHRKANVRYEEGEEHVPPILQGKGIKAFISSDLIEKSVPVKFRTPDGAIASGYRAEILPAVCEVFLKARDAGALQKQQSHIAIHADILIRGLATVGIITLVDEVTGYQNHRERDALAKILEAFIAKELRPYMRTFEADYYKAICRLRGWEFKTSSRRPRALAHITNDVVYSRLAPGVLEELRAKNPVSKPGGRREKKHFQWLTDHKGHPELQKHLQRVTGWMEMSQTWEQFYKILNEKKPVYRGPTLFDDIPEELEPEPMLPASSSTAPPPPSEQSLPAAQE